MHIGDAQGRLRGENSYWTREAVSLIIPCYKLQGMEQNRGLIRGDDWQAGPSARTDSLNFPLFLGRERFARDSFLLQVPVFGRANKRTLCSLESHPRGDCVTPGGVVSNKRDARAGFLISCHVGWTDCIYLKSLPFVPVTVVENPRGESCHPNREAASDQASRFLLAAQDDGFSGSLVLE